MASRKKQRYNDKNASFSHNDTFGTIFDGMLKHKTFQRLSPSSKVLYVCCRNQAQSVKGKTCLYQHGQEYGILYDHNNDFVFPAKHLREYGIDRTNATKYFNELIDAGFLIRKEKNNHRFKVNVYSFSDGWKNSS